MHRQATNDALRRAATQRQENRARRRRRNNAFTQNSGLEGFVRPYVATAQLYVSVGKLWLLVLCYGDLLLRMSRSVDTYVSSFGVPAASAFTKVDGSGDLVSCPHNHTAPVCCLDAYVCRPGSNDGGYGEGVIPQPARHSNSKYMATQLLPSEPRKPISLHCGWDSDESPYMLTADPLDPFANDSLSACCQSSYLGPYASAKAEPLASGGHGGAPGGVTTGAALGLKRCCPLVATGVLASVSTNSTRWDSSCEVSDRCLASLEFGVGCCTHASAANATGATSLTASLRWRPTAVMGVNAVASGVLMVRGAVAYAREVLGWMVFTPYDLHRGAPAPTRQEMERQASCWSSVHAAALAAVCVVLVWAAFIPFWWDLDSAYYRTCHPNVLGDWSHQFDALSNEWRALVKYDVLLTLLHFICDAIIARACRA